MRKTVSKTIGGLEYRVVALGATDSRHVFVRILKMVGGGFDGHLADAIKGLSETDFDYLCETFGNMSTVRLDATHEVSLGMSGMLDDHFAGKFGDMLEWLAFCLEVNYSDFLSKIGLKLDKVMARAKEKLSTSQKDATGLSGE